MKSNSSDGSSRSAVSASACALSFAVTMLLICSCSPARIAHPLGGALEVKTSQIRKKMAVPLPYVIFGESTQGARVSWLVDSGATVTLVKEKVHHKLKGLEITGQRKKARVQGLYADKALGMSTFRWHAPSGPEINGYLYSGRTLGFDGILGVRTLVSSEAVMYPKAAMLRWSEKAGGTVRSKAMGLQVHPVSKHLLVLCSWRGKPLKFLLDTGASRSLCSIRTAKALGMALGKRSQTRLIGVHASHGAAYRMKPVVIDWGNPQDNVKQSISLLATDLSALNRALSGGKETRIDGVLGYDFLSKHCDAIDFKQKALYLDSR